MAPAERTSTVTLRLTEEERRMLTTLADLSGMSASDVLRQLLRKGYERRFACVLCGQRFVMTEPHEGRNPWRQVLDWQVCNRCYRQYDSPAGLQKDVQAAIVKNS